jgi:cellulose synthase (UDP-forming)
MERTELLARVDTTLEATSAPAGPAIGDPGDVAPPVDPPLDPRLTAPRWDAAAGAGTSRVRAIGVTLLGLVAVGGYLLWLTRPERVGNPVLYGVLLVAELFNVLQAIGFWWTCVLGPQRRRARAAAPDRPLRSATRLVDVDVFIPTYSEPVEIVEPVVAAATRLYGARVHVALLDDGNRDEMAGLALRHGVAYVRRTVHSGAKAGNINHALGVTGAPYVLVLDCDHVPAPDLLARALPLFAPDHDPATGGHGRPVAFVQTPQYYANAPLNRVAEASWSQQSLFFGPIARGKDARRTMFCCGTNVVFARDALAEVGGFPEDSVTEDFELSIELHEREWESAYLPRVLASGLGPEDLGAYVSQQHRWARGCVGAIPRIVRSRLPWRHRLQYLLSASFFLTGWTLAIYMAMPIIRILTGAQPIAAASADNFLVAFAPFFGLSLAVVATVGAGRYTFSAYALMAATFWVHIHASCRALFKRPTRFVVTPKNADTDRQWRAAAPTLAVLAVLLLAAAVGLAVDRSAATLNNVAFAAFHIVVLSHGVATAVFPRIARMTPPTDATPLARPAGE